MNRLAAMPSSTPSPRRRADVVVRKGARLASLIAGAFAMSLLGGADGCTITVEPLEDCVELEDVCPDLQCEVFATNDDGCSLCECADPPPRQPDECYSDDECQSGEYCDLSAGSEPQPSNDDNGSSDEAGLRAPGGQCVPLACPAVAPAPPQCEDGQDVVCESDPGDRCNSYCYCVDVDPVSCANVLCAPDTQCVEYDEGPRCEPIDGHCDDDSETICDMVAPTCEDGLIAAERNGCYECVDPATCEPPPPASEGCYSDADCRDGAVCNATDVCRAPPGCEDPDAGCLAVCYGECIVVDEAN